MLENTTTIKAETVDKAIEKGLRELSITRDQAEIRVISEGKKGLFGFGKQDAIVEVSTAMNMSLSELTEQLEQEEHEVKNSTENTASHPKPNPEPKEEEKQEEPQKIDLEEENIQPSIEEIEEVEQKPVKPKAPVKKEKTADPKKSSEATKTVSSNKKETEGNTEVASKPVQPTQKNDINDSKDSDALNFDLATQEVAKYLTAIIEEYGAEADISISKRGKQVIFDIETDKSGLVIGKHGKIINSLQSLAQTLLLSLHRRHINVVLNVGDYRKRRAKVLEQIAMNTADEVIETGQPVILDALPAYERKQIHAHLSHISSVKTHSEGKEPNRYLVVEYVNKK